jgi:isohexenylglutaconyl-CoA hydratase
MIRFEWHGPFAFATLDRPQARHALTDAMVQALLDACAQATARADARALVIRGSGGQFCAGGDFGGFKSMIGAVPPAGAPDPIVGVNRTFGRLLETLAALEVPTVAVVEGAAMGGGVGLAAACDIVIAAASARFATPEVTLGLPPAQIAPFVAARIGDAAAKRMLLTGTTFNADAALALGLVDEVAPDATALDAVLKQRLEALGRAEPAALRATKRLLALRQGTALPQLLDKAAGEFARALRSGAPLEGMAAFAEKRAARWIVTPADDDVR